MTIRDGRLAGLRYQYAKLARWITIDSDQRFNVEVAGVSLTMRMAR